MSGWIYNITQLENSAWTIEKGPDINEPVANHVSIIQDGTSLSLLMCELYRYAGWLAKHIEPICAFPTSLSFNYELLIDIPTLECAQVIETDIKATNSRGLTFDGSVQFNIAEGWEIQVGDPWFYTGVKIPPLDPYKYYDITLEHDFSDARRASKLCKVFINDTKYEIPEHWVEASQVGWTVNELVLQLQQVNNHNAGGYTLNFRDIGISYT